MPWTRLNAAGSLTRLLGVGLAAASACSSGPLHLGDVCIASPPDPCVPGLECRMFVSVPSGYSQNFCQYPFGSLDGGLGQACGTRTLTPSDEELRQSVLSDCAPTGLQCAPSGVADGSLVLSCQLPSPDSQCSVTTGCAFGYPCLPFPPNGGLDGGADALNICVQECQTSAACLLSFESCTQEPAADTCGETNRSDYYPQAMCCSPAPCGQAVVNGRAFTPCTIADAGDGFCLPFDSIGDGTCFAAGPQPVGAPCFGRSEFACQAGAVCAGEAGYGDLALGAPVCVAVCAMPGSPIAEAVDGGPGCPPGQACTRSLDSSAVTGVCAPLCGAGKPSCSQGFSCQVIENGASGCVPGTAPPIYF